MKVSQKLKRAGVSFKSEENADYYVETEQKHLDTEPKNFEIELKLDNTISDMLWFYQIMKYNHSWFGTIFQGDVVKGFIDFLDRFHVLVVEFCYQAPVPYDQFFRVCFPLLHLIISIFLNVLKKIVHGCHLLLSYPRASDFYNFFIWFLLFSLLSSLLTFNLFVDKVRLFVFLQLH